MALIGNNLIVDHVMVDGLEGYHLAECAFLFAHINVLFVGLSCSTKELERRELQRQDREKTFSIDDLSATKKRVHAHGIYDLEIDTTSKTLLQTAEYIREQLANGLQATAFRKIRDLYISHQAL